MRRAWADWWRCYGRPLAGEGPIGLAIGIVLLVIMAGVVGGPAAIALNDAGAGLPVVAGWLSYLAYGALLIVSFTIALVAVQRVVPRWRALPHERVRGAAGHWLGIGLLALMGVVAPLAGWQDGGPVEAALGLLVGVPFLRTAHGLLRDGPEPDTVVPPSFGEPITIGTAEPEGHVVEAPRREAKPFLRGGGTP